MARWAGGVSITDGHASVHASEVKSSARYILYSLRCKHSQPTSRSRKLEGFWRARGDRFVDMEEGEGEYQWREIPQVFLSRQNFSRDKHVDKHVKFS